PCCQSQHVSSWSPVFSCFLFHAILTTETYTLSLHDALPIWSFFPATRSKRATTARLACVSLWAGYWRSGPAHVSRSPRTRREPGDRKSTRLNSSHGSISYAVFCLQKKTTSVAAFDVRKSIDC